MTHDDSSLHCVTRRAWMVLAATALSACGGGGISVTSLPGTGGTGSPVFAQGAISGFGSVIVNGIRFDDLLAMVQVDGLAATSADLRLGMVADVQGARGADLALGTASHIDVWTIAIGSVSQPAANGVVVSGMTVQTSSSTVFDGVGASSELVGGQTVAVWGLQLGADGNRWAATRVAVLPTKPGPVVSSGVAVLSNGQRLLNGLVLTGTLVSDVPVGTLVRAQGALSADGRSLALASVRAFSVGSTNTTHGDAEIEGYVTAMVSADSFTMGSIRVDASRAVVTPTGARLAVGSRVEVDGAWAAGVLKASKIKLDDEQNVQQTEISGVISAFTSIADFVLRGQRCDASLAVLRGGKVSDLKAGVKVKVKGVTAGNLLKVSTLEFGS